MVVGSWATTVKMTGVGLDGKNREMTCIDLRTLTMWLATIDTNRVDAQHGCPRLISSSVFCLWHSTHNHCMLLIVS
ncbi:phage antirepressor N-terminal domain-containing protein [Corynebacterium diphtheriae]|uniref:phage antirepressor N-terminal domain-containing protein n=1 Tax=Corynebacterium diphtheriae TaxID=1717 RepID=UPI003CC7F5A2